MTARIVSILVGVAFLFLAYAANLHWFELHVFWQYFQSTTGELWLCRITRGVLFAVGLAFIGFHRAVAAWAARKPPVERIARAGQFALAIVMALVVAEVLARRKPEEPAPVARWGDTLRDDRFGWMPRPSSSFFAAFDGFPAVYAYDAQSARVRSVSEPTDPSAPSVIFIGESYTYGPGLTYDQTLSTKVGEALGLQPVNYAFPGYGSSQEYFKLEKALATYKSPVAVVFAFLPAQLARDTDDRHPHLERDGDDGLRFVPAEAAWRRFRVRYALREALHLHSGEAVRLTAAIVRQEAAMVRAHGGVPLWFIPVWGEPRPVETLKEHWLLQELFEKQGLDYVLSFFPTDTLLPGDPHPGPRAIEYMARPIVDELIKKGVGGASAASGARPAP
jgi:hypothetical protein